MAAPHPSPVCSQFDAVGTEIPGAASSYRLLSGFDRITYMRWCPDHETDCLSASWSGRWTNESAEREFGRAAPVGQLDAPEGAPRWKQRAFYDFAKDLTPVTPGVPVARLSIYDRLEVDGKPIEAHALLDRTAADESARSAAEAVAGWVRRAHVHTLRRG